MFAFLCGTEIKDAPVAREMHNNSITVSWHRASSGDGRKIYHKTPVRMYQITRRHIQEDSTLHSHRHELLNGSMRRSPS